MPGHLPRKLHRRIGVNRRSTRGRLQISKRITQEAQVGAHRLCSIKVDEQSDGTDGGKALLVDIGYHLSRKL